MLDPQSFTITTSLLLEWQEERTALLSKISAMRDKVGDYDRKIEAASFFLPFGASADHVEPTVKSDAEPENLTLISKIVMTVRAAKGGFLDPKQIKLRLAAQGLYPDGSSPNYFYSALKRAADRRLIHAQDGKYYARTTDQAE